MPILPREADLYPADLLTAQQADGNWWVAHTMSRQEKELMRRLRLQEIGFFGPLIAKKNRAPSGRVRTSHVPLFPGYVFFHGNEQQRQLALTSNCIANTIQVHEPEPLLEDLRQICQLVESGAPLTPESRIEAGQYVRVKTGPFAGVEGMVCKRHSGDRLIVVVGFLQQGASVAVEDFQVEPI